MKLKENTKKIKLINPCQYCQKKKASVSRKYPTDSEDILYLCAECSKKKVCVYCGTQPITSNKGHLCHQRWYSMEPEQQEKLRPNNS